jgi:hypothetical protein
MLRLAARVALCVSVAVLVAVTSDAETRIVLKSIRIDLPNSDRLFAGAGADPVNNNCLACHSAGMVENQPSLSRAQWQAEVDKMIDSYKAPVQKEDIAAIVEYLVKTKGPK